MKVAADLMLVHDEENVRDRIVIVGLHGLGGSGLDMIACLEAMRFPSDVAVRCIALQADEQPVTLNNGCVMPAWFDILSLNREDDQDEAGIEYAANKLCQFIDHLSQEGESSESIYLLGFSQGGALALFSGLHAPWRLGGVIALSTYMPMINQIDTDALMNEDLPIFMAHGRFDDVVFPEWGQKSHQKLLEWGYEPEFREYAMDHSIVLEELNDISEWILSKHVH